MKTKISLLIAILFAFSFINLSFADPFGDLKELSKKLEKIVEEQIPEPAQENANQDDIKKKSEELTNTLKEQAIDFEKQIDEATKAAEQEQIDEATKAAEQEQIDEATKAAEQEQIDIYEEQDSTFDEETNEGNVDDDKNFVLKIIDKIFGFIGSVWNWLYETVTSVFRWIWNLIF